MGINQCKYDSASMVFKGTRGVANNGETLIYRIYTCPVCHSTSSVLWKKERETSSILKESLNIQKTYSKNTQQVVNKQAIKASNIAIRNRKKARNKQIDVEFEAKLEAFRKRRKDAEQTKTVIENNEVQLKDFFVRRSVLRCTCKNHSLKNIEASIKIITYEGEILPKIVTAGYCEDCNIYIILESTYQYIKSVGIPLCRISDEKNYVQKGRTASGMHLANESILKQFGYSVSESEHISENQRRIILIYLIDTSILTKNEIISYLDFFIRQRKNRIQYRDAIEKWQMDRAFIMDYKAGDYSLYGIRGIMRK